MLRLGSSSAGADPAGSCPSALAMVSWRDQNRPVGGQWRPDRLGDLRWERFVSAGYALKIWCGGFGLSGCTSRGCFFWHRFRSAGYVGYMVGASFARLPAEGSLDLEIAECTHGG